MTEDIAITRRPGAPTGAPSPAGPDGPDDLTTTAYGVLGLTCGHCVAAVTGELTAVDGVRSVAVDLVAGGRSVVTVTSAGPPDEAAVSAAVDEAGYEFAGRAS